MKIMKKQQNYSSINSGPYRFSPLKQTKKKEKKISMENAANIQVLDASDLVERFDEITLF